MVIGIFHQYEDKKPRSRDNVKTVVVAALGNLYETGRFGRLRALVKGMPWTFKNTSALYEVFRLL